MDNVKDKQVEDIFMVFHKKWIDTLAKCVERLLRLVAIPEYLQKLCTVLFNKDTGGKGKCTK